MSIEIAEAIWLGVGAYFAVGLVFALVFVTFLLPRLDHAGVGAPLQARAILVPGVAGLWPLMLIRTLTFRRINAPHDDAGTQT